MTKKYFFIWILTVIVFSCKHDTSLTRIEGSRLEINDSIATDADIESFVKPYREHVTKNLDSVLSYAVETYTKKDGEFNTAIGNMMADAVLEESDVVFKARTGNTIDMVLLNYGGIRSILSKGNITSRTAYKLMPFENSIVVAELKGVHVKELITYLQKAKRAHPIAGLKLKIDKNYNVIEATIQGNTIVDDKIYYVATNDYLFSGGDHMDFFKNSENAHYLNYKIRNILLDYFKKKDTISPVIDDRFIMIN